MAQLTMRLVDDARYSKNYPIVGQIKKPRYLANKELIMENILVNIIQAHEVTVSFEKPFPAAPAIAADFYTDSQPAGSVNVYITNVTTTSVTIETSADVTGKISIQAVYIGP